MLSEIRKTIASCLCAFFLVPTVPHVTSAEQNSQPASRATVMPSSASAPRPPRADTITPGTTTTTDNNSHRESKHRDKYNQPEPHGLQLSTKPWIVDMQIGQPSVWSLAQAHYLLSQV